MEILDVQVRTTFQGWTLCWKSKVGLTKMVLQIRMAKDRLGAKLLKRSVTPAHALLQLQCRGVVSCPGNEISLEISLIERKGSSLGLSSLSQIRFPRIPQRCTFHLLFVTISQLLFRFRKFAWALSHKNVVHARPHCLGSDRKGTVMPGGRTQGNSHYEIQMICHNYISLLEVNVSGVPKHTGETAWVKKGRKVVASLRIAQKSFSAGVLQVEWCTLKKALAGKSFFADASAKLLTAMMGQNNTFISNIYHAKCTQADANEKFHSVRRIHLNESLVRNTVTWNSNGRGASEQLLTRGILRAHGAERTAFLQVFVPGFTPLYKR